jgi:uncharacterized protein YwgA
MLGLRLEGRGPALDPVRIQKSLFLITQRNLIPSDQRYTFEPYNYGPYSFAARDDLDALVAEGLAAQYGVPGYSWSRYHLTDRGLARLRELFVHTDNGCLEEAAAVKQHVADVSFNTLLSEVYEEFPDYATRSVFKR